MFQRILKLLMAAVLILLPLGTQSADARGGGRGGAGRSAGRMGGSRGGRGSKKGKAAKAFRERTLRENHDAFKRDASGDAQ